MTDKKLEDEHIEVFTQAMQETWLNRHGLSRLVRFILVIIISVVVTMVINTTTIRDSQVQACENGKQLVEQFYDFVDNARIARLNAAAKEHGDIQQNDYITAAKYASQLVVIKKSLNTSCSKIYPSPIPFIE